MKPIGSFISGERLNLAELQDYVIDIIYDEIQPNALLYGETAIWRCFDGSRFSEDIDIYMDRSPFSNFVSKLGDYGLNLTWRDPELPTRVRVSNGVTDLLLESKPWHAENEIRTYSRTDGTSKTISVLSPTELMTRKIEAYQGRKFIRDIYDLFILTNWLDRADYVVKSRLSQFLATVQKPVDEPVLTSLLYKTNGNLSFLQMTDYLQRWLREI